MAKFICLLRGINVGGKRIIKMDALKQLFQDLGAKNTKTYIQSGNVVFDWNDVVDETDFSAYFGDLVTQEISKRFGLEVPTLILSESRLFKIQQSNPWLSSPEKYNPDFFHVTILAGSSVIGLQSLIELADLQHNEACGLDDIDVVYLYCVEGYSNCKLSNNWIEGKVKTACTTRNWKTICELMKMCND